MPSDDIRDLTLRVKVDGNQLKTLGADFRKTGDAARDAGKEAETAGQRARRFFRKLPGTAKSVAAFYLLKQAFDQIRKVLSDSIREAVSYQSAFSQIIGLVGVSREQAALWGEDLKRLGPEVGKGLGELSDALFFISSAGFDGAEAIDVLTTSAKASTAGLGETKDIADLVTSAINAYGKENLSASEAADILTAAVREGKAEADEYASVLGRVLADANQLGVEFSEVAGTISALSLVGTDPAEGVTQLRAILVGLLRPSEQAKEALAEVGLSFADIRRTLRDDGLLAAIEQLKVVSTELGEDRFARLFESTEALSAVFKLTGANAGQTREVLESTANSSGAAQAAFDEAASTAQFWYDVLKSRLGVVMVNFGTFILPIVTGGVRALAALVGILNDAFTGLYRTVKNVFKGISESISGTLSAADRFLRRLPRNAGPGAPPELAALVPAGAGGGIDLAAQVAAARAAATAEKEKAEAARETVQASRQSAEAARETLETDRESLKVKEQIAEATKRLNEISLDLLPEPQRLARARDEALGELDEIAAAIPERAAEAERARLAITEKYSKEITEADHRVLTERLKNSNSFYDRLRAEAIEFRRQIAEDDRLTAEFFADTLSQMRNAFSDLFYNAITGKFNDLADLARNTWSAILRSFTHLLAQMATRRLVLNIVPNFTGGAGIQGAGGLLSRIPGFGPGQVFGGPTLPLGGVGPVQPTPFLASGAANLLGGVFGAYNVFGSLFSGNVAGGTGAAIGGGIGAAISSAVPGIGTLVGFGIGSAIGKLIGGFFRKKPKLDIDIEPSDRAIVEDLLADSFADSIKISSRRTGVDRSRIRSAVAGIVQGQIANVRAIIATLPEEVAESLDKSLLATAVDTREHFGSDRLLEFDVKGKRIQEELEQFLGGELSARFLVSIREFFEGAFSALGVLPGRAEGVVDEVFSRFRAESSREERSAIAQELLALFASAAATYNLVNESTLDPLAHQIREAEEAAAQFGFEGIPSLEAVTGKLRELLRDFDDPRAVQGLIAYRQALIEYHQALTEERDKTLSLRREIVGSFASASSSIRNTAARIAGLGALIGRDLGGRHLAALRKNVSSVDAALATANISLAERTSLLDEQYSSIQAIVSLERQRFEEAKRAEVAALQAQRDRLDLQRDRLNLEHERLAEQIAAIEELRVDFTSVKSSIDDALLGLRTGPESPLSPIDSYLAVQTEISRLQELAKSAEGQELADIQRQLAQLFPQAVRIAREAFGEGSSAAFAAFRAAQEGLKALQEQAVREIVKQQQLEVRQHELAERQNEIARQQSEIARQHSEIAARIEEVNNRQFTVSVETQRIIDAHLSDQSALLEEQQASQESTISELVRVNEQLRRIEAAIERGSSQANREMPSASEALRTWGTG